MRWCAVGIVAMMAACGWPETKLEPAGDYAAADKASVSAAPSYTAGPTTVRTYSPDGSTRFICESGGSISATNVEPGSIPAC